MTTPRQRVCIDRAWVKRREALLVAWEDEIIRTIRERASGEERAFMDRLVAERERNARLTP